MLISLNMHGRLIDLNCLNKWNKKVLHQDKMLSTGDTNFVGLVIMNQKHGEAWSRRGKCSL